MSKINRKHKSIISIIIIFCLISFFIIGFFTCKILTKNDKFEINGQKTIELNVGESYEGLDAGATAISFGKDISNKIIVTNNIDKTKPGKYYFKYTINSIRYKNVVKYRYIIYKEVL